jgi:hypothetical protein
MRHVKRISCETLPGKAQSDTVCGYLFFEANTKCVDADSPLANILKRVPIE